MYKCGINIKMCKLLDICLTYMDGYDIIVSSIVKKGTIMNENGKNFDQEPKKEKQEGNGKLCY